MWQVAVLPYAAAGFVAETSGNAAFRMLLGGMSVMEALTHWGAKAEPFYEGRVKFLGLQSDLLTGEEAEAGSEVGGTVWVLSKTYRVRAGSLVEASGRVCSRFTQEHPSVKAEEMHLLPASLKRV